MSEETVPYEVESTYEEMVYYRGRVTTLSAEVTKLRQRAEAAEREREQLRGQLSTLSSETSELLELAYNVYRDAGGKVGDNSIFSFGEWLQWLPTQTDENLRV